MQEVWLSCQALLSHGSSHCRDGYMALALFSEFLLPSPISPRRKGTSDIKPNGEFELRDQAEFWEVLKKGLVLLNLQNISCLLYLKSRPTDSCLHPNCM